MVKKSKLKGIKNIGSYYYDDSKTKTNGEFDVVLEQEDGFAIYEVKYLKNKVEDVVVHSELEQIKNIKGINVNNVGFVNPNGFEKKIDGIDYIEDIYNLNITL